MSRGGSRRAATIRTWSTPGSYGNLLTRKDLRTGITFNVNPWPDNPMGHPAMDPKYRFQWTFPIIVSTHDPNVVYAGSNVVHKTTNGGRSWTAISPDLTYHDPATLGNSGGPMTKDQTSVEYYGDGVRDRGVAGDGEDALDRLGRRQGVP